MKQHVNQEKENKIIMQKWGGRRMRNVKHKSERWSVAVLLAQIDGSYSIQFVYWTDNLLQEEEALAQKAKEEEAAALEFDKWKGEFSVDAEGTTENAMQDEGQGLLSSFVEYIKVHFSFPF